MRPTSPSTAEFPCPDCRARNPVRRGEFYCDKCGWGKADIKRGRAKQAWRKRNFPGCPIGGKRTPEGCILKLPLPPSKNDEPKHPMQIHSLRNHWRGLAWCAWIAAGRPRFTAVEIQPVFYVVQVRDDDNQTGQAFKGLQDGLVGNMVVDDNPKYLHLLDVRTQIDRTRPRLELHVREVRDRASINGVEHTSIGV